MGSEMVKLSAMKYFIWVLGCAMNNSDAERIAAVLNLLGYAKTENESEADLIITIACSVRQHAIDRIYGSAKKWKVLKKKSSNLKTILTGCVLEKDLPRMRKIFDVIFEIDELSKLPGLLGDEIAPEKIDTLGKSGEYLGIMPSYEFSFRAYVPIMTGCNNFCSYCAVPYTRGREKSRPQAEIFAEVSDLVSKGFKEITLLGQNVNSYGKNDQAQMPNDKFVDLIMELDKIEGDHRIYFYSNHPKDMSDELIELMPKLKHFPAYIHLPLQSGSDEIIRKMNRHYTKEKYLELVAKIKKAMPDVTLTTDIIVGYPGETEADFAETVTVAEEAKYDMIFLAQYSPREGTPSAKIKDDVSAAEKKKRENVLQKVLEETAGGNNQKLVGTTQKVLIDGQKPARPAGGGVKYYGRTEGYKVVVIKTDQALRLGQFTEVKIGSAGPWKLIGKLL